VPWWFTILPSGCVIGINPDNKTAVVAYNIASSLQNKLNKAFGKGYNEIDQSKRLNWQNFPKLSFLSNCQTLRTWSTKIYFNLPLAKSAKNLSQDTPMQISYHLNYNLFWKLSLRKYKSVNFNQIGRNLYTTFSKICFVDAILLYTIPIHNSLYENRRFARNPQKFSVVSVKNSLIRVSSIKTRIICKNKLSHTNYCIVWSGKISWISGINNFAQINKDSLPGYVTYLFRSPCPIGKSKLCAIFVDGIFSRGFRLARVRVWYQIFLQKTRVSENAEIKYFLNLTCYS
jgi:hypothetical protein